jgi:hypothetical protein
LPSGSQKIDGCRTGKRRRQPNQVPGEQLAAHAIKDPQRQGSSRNERQSCAHGAGRRQQKSERRDVELQPPLYRLQKPVIEIATVGPLYDQVLAIEQPRYQRLALDHLAGQ